MHTRLALLIPLVAVACSADPGVRALELRPTTGSPVSGSDFQCTGTPPDERNPCHAPWSSVPATSAVAGDAHDELRLTLHRDPIAVDGASSIVTINLVFDAAGHLTAATASETTSGAHAGQLEHSAPVSGYLEPVVVANSPSGRNAGRFALTFAWGTMQGTYDTAN